MEGAEPAGLDKPWWGRSCSRHPRSAGSRQREGYSSGKHFVGRGQNTRDRESHQGTKGKQENTWEIRDGRNHSST